MQVDVFIGGIFLGFASVLGLLVFFNQAALNKRCRFCLRSERPIHHRTCTECLPYTKHIKIKNRVETYMSFEQLSRVYDDFLAFNGIDPSLAALYVWSEFYNNISKERERTRRILNA